MPAFCSACSRTHLHVNESFFASVFGTFLKIIRQLGCLTQSDSVARSSGSLGTRAECDKGIYIGTQPCPPVLLRPRLRRASGSHMPRGRGDMDADAPPPPCARDGVTQRDPSTWHGLCSQFQGCKPLSPPNASGSLPSRVFILLSRYKGRKIQGASSSQLFPLDFSGSSAKSWSRPPNFISTETQNLAVLCLSQEEYDYCMYVITSGGKKPLTTYFLQQNSKKDLHIMFY